MKLIASIQDYLNFLRHEQGAAKTTYKSYHAYLINFHEWLTTNGYPEAELTDFNTATVRRFFYHVSSKGLRPRSIYGYMIPLRSYGAFLVKQKILTENPAASIQLPKKDAAIRTEASEEEISLLLECVDRQRNRNHAIFQKAVLATLVYTGIRRAELCDLKLTDANLRTGWLLVRMGKGSKSRKVPLCAEVKDAIAAWLAVRPEDTEHDYLFSVSKTRRLYFAGVHSVMEEVKHFAGLGDRSDLTPHTLRHACASRLMRNGASLFEVMTWLGHTQISTTQRYLHVNEEQLQKTAHLASLQPQKKDDGKVIDIRDRQQNQDRTRRRIAR